MGRFESLKTLGELLDPRVGKRLYDAGAINLRTPLTIARSLPWLVGRGPTLGLASKMHADALADKPAIHDRRGTLTWKELDERANQAAHAFESLGLGAGSNVALMLRNGREFAEAILGTQKIGAFSSPLNTWAKPKELKTTITNSGAAVLIYDTAHTEQVRASVPEGLPLYFVGDPSAAIEGSESYEELLRHQPTTSPPPFTRARGEPKVIIHTSGTTGTPKGATRGTSASGLGALSSLLGVIPYHRDDIVLIPAPMFHSFGLGAFVFATVLGSTMVLPEKFDPQETLSLIERHRATTVSLVPVMIRRIVDLDPQVRNKYDLSSVRIVIASGSVLSEDLRRAATDVFGPVLYDLYGSTEAGWIAIATPHDLRIKPRSVGKPTPGISVAIFSSDGRRVPEGVTGEIHVKSDVIFEGYTSGDTKGQREGYMSIGDLGRFDSEGYLYVESRADDMVVVGGENVYPIEIEQVIEDMEGVHEVAVVGAHDEAYGQILAAFVTGTVTEQEVIDVCKRELASYKVPRKVIVLDELPRTSTGKVLKRELIQQLSGS
ncbi:MAG TPA: AMP-binding protein [Actinomycetota bacterium]|nr:AMP-binding protein [Actinomycetota bacterium]